MVKGMIYHRGDTVGVKNTFKDKAKALMDPDTHSIQVYDPNETAMLGSPATNPTKESTGIYEWFYNLPSDAAYGDWTISWFASKGSDKNTEEYHFTVQRKKGD